MMTENLRRSKLDLPTGTDETCPTESGTRNRCLPRTRSSTSAGFGQRIVLALFFVICWLNAGAATGEHADIARLKDVSLASPRIVQGDPLKIAIVVDVSQPLQQLTATFRVVDDTETVIAELMSDFFDLGSGTNQSISFEFRWADLVTERSGKLAIAQTSLNRHNLGDQSFRSIADNETTVSFEVVPVLDEIERMYVSRENSRHWLSTMGLVDNELARRHKLANCVMYGGLLETWIRNDYLATEGKEGLCYWEITGYAISALALEYGRTGDKHYLDLAQKTADVVVNAMHDGRGAAYLKGSLPTFNHYDGREGEWYKGKSMLFDHGQILRGLLDLASTMRAAQEPADRVRRIESAARAIGEFMLRARDMNDGAIPTFVEKATGKVSKDVQPSSKVVVGFSGLQQLMPDKEVRHAAVDHLGRMLRTLPYSGEDHHGRSYTAYGFLQAFKDYGEESYLLAAADWTASVAEDMGDDGRLIPDDEFSAIPAQSQLIRNGSLLWELTGNPRYLEWAERSAQFLTESAEPWMYGQPVLALGTFFRQAGGQFNNAAAEELCPWASIFHIDAMYHYLRLKYGHVYVGPTRVLSLTAPTKAEWRQGSVELRVRSMKEENLGIYVAQERPISRLKVGGKDFPYHSDHTARLPPAGSVQSVEIAFGEDSSSHIIRTNSLVVNATRPQNGALNVELEGMRGTTGRLELFWPGTRPRIHLDGEQLDETKWSWDEEGETIEIRYRHNGEKQKFEIAS